MRTIVFLNGGVAAVVTEDPEAEVVIIDYDYTPNEAPDKDGDGERCRIIKGDTVVIPDLVEKHLGPKELYPLKVQFGSTPELKDNIEELSFESKRSRDAYINGLDDMDGYFDYNILDETDEEYEDDG